MMRYVLGFVYDCQGNPLAGAEVAFHSVTNGRRRLLGRLPTSGNRSRPVGILLAHKAAEVRIIEVRAFAGRQSSAVLHVDSSNNRTCEFVFHIGSGHDQPFRRNGRRLETCRCPDRTPEALVVT